MSDFFLPNLRYFLVFHQFLLSLLVYKYDQTNLSYTHRGLLNNIWFHWIYFWKYFIMIDKNQIVGILSHGFWIEYRFSVTLIFQNPLNGSFFFSVFQNNGLGVQVCRVVSIFCQLQEYHSWIFNSLRWEFQTEPVFKLMDTVFVNAFWPI